MGRTLIIVGTLIVVMGILINVFQTTSIPRLPGDIFIKREGFTFYFPLGWCILISVVLGAIRWFVGK